LGQSDEIVEYKPDVNPRTTWKQEGDALHITAYRAQRLYTDRSWPDPVVLKLTHVQPAMQPPAVVTGAAEWNPRGGNETLHGRLTDMGGVERVEVGFQYRVKKDGTDLSERIEPWTDLPTSPRTATGEFTFTLGSLIPNREYEFRAQVKHPLLTTYGQEKTFRTSEGSR
jgi:alpha-L-fucosidase